MSSAATRLFGVTRVATRAPGLGSYTQNAVIDTSRVRRSHRTFNHNSVTALQQVLEQIISEKKGADMGRYSVFVVVESEGDRRIGGGALFRGKWILVAVEVSPISLSNPPTSHLGHQNFCL